MKFTKLQAYQADIESVLRQRRKDAAQLGAKPKEAKAKASGDKLELFVYGPIGESFWDEGVSALDVNEQLAGFDGSEIAVRINSPGGDVFDGIAMFNALQSHPANVTTIVEGQAMSAGSLVLQAGDMRIAEQATTTMIHRAWTMAMGNANDLTAVAEILAGIDSQLGDLYASTAGIVKEKAIELMDAETFMGPEQALELGFVDRIGQAEPVEASAPYERLRARLQLTN